MFLAALLGTAIVHAQTGPTSEREAAQPDKTEQRPAAVFGLVTNSLTGEPLAHANVRLDNYTLRQGSRYGAITTVDGRFSIKSIVPGRYHVRVERRGYRPLPGQEESFQPLELKAGEEVRDLLLRLVPDAVISGRVVDAKGVHMEQVDVEVVGAETQSVLTDDRGEFRIGGLREGHYLIKAMSYPPPLPPEIRTDGTSETTYGPTYYPSSPSAKSAALVRAQAGQETSGIEIKLVPAPILHVSGMISNVPPGVRNIMVRVDNDSTMERHVDVLPDMTFTAWRLPPGRYQVFADCFDENSKRELRTAPAEFNLTTTSIGGLNLVFSQPSLLIGRMEAEGGEAITGPGSTPSLMLRRLGATDNSYEDANMKPDGSFIMKDVFPGRYRVLVEDLSYPWYVKSVRLEGKESDDGILDLRSAPSQAQVTVLLAHNGAEVTGVARDANGPVAGIQVSLFFDDEYAFDVASSTGTQADGSYVFRGIRPGKYRILAYDPKKGGAAASSDSLALFDSVTEKLDVSTEDKLTQDLRLLP